MKQFLHPNVVFVRKGNFCDFSNLLFIYFIYLSTCLALCLLSQFRMESFNFRIFAFYLNHLNILIHTRLECHTDFIRKFENS